jgi:hypothetical protein
MDLKLTPIFNHPISSEERAFTRLGLLAFPSREPDPKAIARMLAYPLNKIRIGRYVTNYDILNLPRQNRYVVIYGDPKEDSNREFMGSLVYSSSDGRILQSSVKIVFNEWNTEFEEEIFGVPI